MLTGLEVKSNVEQEDFRASDNNEGIDLRVIMNFLNKIVLILTCILLFTLKSSFSFCLISHFIEYRCLNFFSRYFSEMVSGAANIARLTKKGGRKRAYVTNNGIERISALSLQLSSKYILSNQNNRVNIV